MNKKYRLRACDEVFHTKTMHNNLRLVKSCWGDWSRKVWFISILLVRTLTKRIRYTMTVLNKFRNHVGYSSTNFTIFLDRYYNWVGKHWRIRICCNILFLRYKNESNCVYESHEFRKVFTWCGAHALDRRLSVLLLIGCSKFSVYTCICKSIHQQNVRWKWYN